jgi:hypothetical protein
MSLTTNTIGGTHDKALTLLKRVDENQKSYQDTLATIETKLQGLLVAQSITTAPSSSAASSDWSQHFVVLENRIAAATSAVSNPLLRSALQQELESILRKLAACLARVSDTEPGLNEAIASEVPDVATSWPLYLKTYTKLIGSFTTTSVFGTFHLTSTLTITLIPQKYGELRCQEIRTTHSKAVLHPPQWLQQCGLNRGLFMRLSLSSWGLDSSLKSYRAVPDDAPVFGFCREGNIKAVQVLFDRGLASPWDTDSRGFTPLFVSPRTAY